MAFVKNEVHRSKGQVESPNNQTSMTLAFRDEPLSFISFFKNVAFTMLNEGPLDICV